MCGDRPMCVCVCVRARVCVCQHACVHACMCMNACDGWVGKERSYLEVSEIMSQPKNSQIKLCVQDRYRDKECVSG